MLRKLKQLPAWRAAASAALACSGHVRDYRRRHSRPFSPVGHYLDFFNNTRSFEIKRRRRAVEDELDPALLQTMQMRKKYA